MSKLHHEERFRHVNYHATDVTKTWARERKRLAEVKAQQEADKAEAQTKTVQLKRRAI